MKKLYTFIFATAFAVSASAQTVEGPQPFVTKTSPFHTTTTAVSGRTILNPDTTGVVNITDFLPAFDLTSPTFYSYGIAGNTHGYLYGNNSSTNGFKQVAQGYQNVNGYAVDVIGALCWFGGKQSDLGSSGTSKVVIKAYDMQPNLAYNVNAGAFNSTVLNWPGPSTMKASTDILFADIDTANFNYVSFATTASICATCDFAISCDLSTLAAGDTAGLVSDAANDALNQDYAYHQTGNGKWFVTDEMFSGATATGGLDNSIALWAVITEATGVNEFFNGMKLTTFPNPTVNNAVIEYTLEKDSKNVMLLVIDPAGKKIVENVYGDQSTGKYTVNLPTTNLAAGTYFYQLRANGRMFTKQFVVTK